MWPLLYPRSPKNPRLVLPQDIPGRFGYVAHGQCPPRSFQPDIDQLEYNKYFQYFPRKYTRRHPRKYFSVSRLPVICSLKLSIMAQLRLNSKLHYRFLQCHNRTVCLKQLIQTVSLLFLISLCIAHHICLITKKCWINNYPVINLPLHGPSENNKHRIVTHDVLPLNGQNSQPLTIFY